MQSFVNQAAQRGTKPTRQQIAQSAFISVKRGRPSNTPQKQDTPRAEILREGAAHSQATRGPFDDSVYDGDTMTSQGRVLVEDSQMEDVNLLQPEEYQEESGTEEEDGESEVGEDEDEDEEQIRGIGQEASQPMNEVIQHAASLFNNPQIAMGDHFGLGGGESYPSTTSGHPDEDDEAEQPGPPEQSNRPMIYAYHQQHNPRASGMAPPPVPHPAQSRFPSQPRAITKTSHAFISQAQPVKRHTLTYRHEPVSMVNKSTTRQAGYASPTPQHTQFPSVHGMSQSKARPNTGGSSRPLSQATMRGGPTPNFEEQSEHHMPELDYDMDTLKDISYEELRKQDFDDNPTKPASVLTEQENSKPLPERLAVVEKKKDDEKRVFLAELTLNEWEEAGDWFLERFGQVMSKMKDARKERRRLAMEFEEEVFKRHQKVQGKKRGIEQALGQMNKNGQEILRASTPGKKTETPSKKQKA